MKKKYLLIFLLLQFLLIIVGLLDTDIDYYYGFKLLLIVYNFAFIFLSPKIEKKSKLLAIIPFISLLFIKDNFYYNSIDYLYIISTFGFVLLYHNNVKKYRIVNYFTLLFVILNFYSLIQSSSSFYLELLIITILPIALIYFESDKTKSLLLIIFTLVVSYLNNMNLVVYSLLIISLLLIIYSFIKKRKLLFPFIILILSIGMLIICKSYDLDTIYDTFSRFELKISLDSIIILLIPSIILLKMIYTITTKKINNIGLILNTYSLLLLTIFGLFSLININNELVIITYSYLFVLEFKMIDNLKKELDDSVTIFALHIGFGGIEQYVSSLTKMLDKKIKIVSTYKIYDKPPFEYNATIRYLMKYGPNTKEIKSALKNKSIIKIIKESIISIKVLYLKHYENIESIENNNSKYIITTRDFHNELVGFYAKKDTIKIATEHNYHDNNKKYIRRVVNSVYNVDFFVLVSEYLKEYYDDKVRPTVLYIPNVIDEMPKTKSNNYDHTLISIGRLSKVKAQEDLIELVSLLKKDYKDIKLTLIGDGEEKENLEKLIKDKKLNDNVLITGFLNKKEIAKEFEKNNIFVTTSRSESFGLVAIEACSYKLPTVAFDSALGLKEILKNDNGILIENRDIKEMKKAIEKLFNDKKYRDTIAQNGYINSKKYLISNVEKMWKKIIK